MQGSEHSDLSEALKLFSLELCNSNNSMRFQGISHPLNLLFCMVTSFANTVGPPSGVVAFPRCADP